MGSVSLDGIEVALSPTFQLFMSISLVVMMFTVALGLRVADFRGLAREPVPVAGGAFTQLIGLPVLTFALVLLIRPDPSVALGMFVVASCPGGNVSNALTMFARGDTAFSVSLTAISSVMSAFLTPITILLLSNLYAPTAALIQSMDIGVLPFLLRTFALLGLPLAAGITVAERYPEVAERMRKLLRPVAFMILVGLIVVGAYANRDVLFGSGMLIFPLVGLHNALAFALGGAVALLLQLSLPRVRALSFEVGIQNAGLGLVILLAQFGGSGGAVAVTALWGIWHILAGFLLVGVYRSWEYWTSRRDQTAE